MQTTNPHGCSRQSAIPASAGLNYYPAIRKGMFPNVRAALAAIGCFGTAADLQLANAAAEGSEAVAVPVTPSASVAGGEFIGVIHRKPGGRAVLFLGMLHLASADHDEVHAVAQALADVGPGGTAGEVCVFEWTRQTRAVQ